jgi:hypothetical protein
MPQRNGTPAVSVLVPVFNAGRPGRLRVLAAAGLPPGLDSAAGGDLAEGQVVMLQYLPREDLAVPRAARRLVAEPAFVEDLAVRGLRQVERYGGDRCAETYVRLYAAEAAR